MKVIVAGGAGFIGSHLCERLLNENHQVICVDNLITGSDENIKHLKPNTSFKFINHNVINPLPSTLSCDALFHLASPASPNHHSPVSYHALPVETMLVNTTGTMHLLDHTKKNNAKFLFASTSEVYGNPLEHPQKETYLGNVSTVGLRSVYDEAKRFGETITAYYERTGVDARIIRIFNTYGPRMQKNDMRMIINFINQGLQNKPITVFGDGTQSRSLCYVEDTIDGLMKLMFLPNTKGEIINVGSPNEHTVLEYATLVKKILNSSSEIILSEKLPADDPQMRRPDITKAKNILGWEPKTSLEKGLSLTIDYIKSLK